MKLTKEDLQGLKMFEDIAKSMGFGDVDFTSIAASMPEPKDYTGLEVGIRQDDGTIETLVYGENGFEKR